MKTTINAFVSIAFHVFTHSLLFAAVMLALVACAGEELHIYPNPATQVTSITTFSVYPQGKDTYTNDEIAYGFNADGQIVQVNDLSRRIYYQWDASTVTIRQTNTLGNDTTLRGMVALDRQRRLPQSAVLTTTDGATDTYSFSYDWTSESVLATLTVNIEKSNGAKRQIIFDFSDGFATAPIDSCLQPVVFCPLFLEYRGKLGGALSRLLSIGLAKTIGHLPKSILLMTDDENGQPDWSKLMAASVGNSNKDINFEIGKVSIFIDENEDGNKKPLIVSINANQFVTYVLKHE